MPLAITIPLANEEKTVELLTKEVLPHLGEKDSLLFILDLSSKDNTRNICNLLGENDPRIQILFKPHIKNVVEAYQHGFRTAAAQGFSQILEMDGGGSHNPQEISRFLSPNLSKYDFIGGSRFLKGGAYTGRPSRKLASFLGTVYSKLLLGGKMSDMTSGFELFQGHAIQKMLSHQFQSTGHFYQTEVRLLMQGTRWTEVPISYKATTGLPKNAILKALKTPSKKTPQIY